MVIDDICCFKVRSVAKCEDCYRFYDCLDKRSKKKQSDDLGKLIAEDDGCLYYIDEDANCFAVTKISQVVVDVPEAIVKRRRRVLLPKGDKFRWKDLAVIAYKAFIGPIPEGKIVGFSDKDPENCHYRNLVLLDETVREDQSKAPLYIVSNYGYTTCHKNLSGAAKDVGLSPKDLRSLLLSSKRGEAKVRPGVFVSKVEVSDNARS